MYFPSNNENCIEWLNNQKEITLSLCQEKWINKIKKLHKNNPDDVEIIAENVDGSICAKLPISFLKISPPRQVTEEQRQLASERFKKMHEENKL